MYRLLSVSVTYFWINICNNTTLHSHFSLLMTLTMTIFQSESVCWLRFSLHDARKNIAAAPVAASGVHYNWQKFIATDGDRDERCMYDHRWFLQLTFDIKANNNTKYKYMYILTRRVHKQQIIMVVFSGVIKNNSSSNMIKNTCSKVNSMVHNNTFSCYIINYSLVSFSPGATSKPTACVLVTAAVLLN